MQGYRFRYIGKLPCDFLFVNARPITNLLSCTASNLLWIIGEIFPFDTEVHTRSRQTPKLKLVKSGIQGRSQDFILEAQKLSAEGARIEAP